MKHHSMSRAMRGSNNYVYGLMLLLCYFCPCHLVDNIMFGQEVSAFVIPCSANTKRTGHRGITTATTTAPSQTQQHAYSLNTALEWLELDRQTFGKDADNDNGDDSANKSHIQWIDPVATTTTTTTTPAIHPDDEIVKMPIYPLGACYLPYPNTIHTLNNVEPRNIQMALDLTATAQVNESGDDSTSKSQFKHWKDSKFCVVLRAADTGRIASVGTVMNIVSIEPQYDPHSTRRRTDSEDNDNDNDPRNSNIKDIVRIIVKCRAEQELVDIVQIENPNAASPQSRLVRSPEYLVAHCRSRSRRQSRQHDANDDDDTYVQTIKQLMSRLIDDYTEVRSLYLQGHGSQDLPPFAQEQLRNHLPELTTTTTAIAATAKENDRIDDDDDDDTNAKFWELAQIWQTLCYTIREGKQINLSSDVNEIMIDAAMMLGGPLKLPVHLEDLPPDTRYQVNEMEQMAQAEFLSLRLDPCLDFQRLLGTPKLLPRLEMLSSMIQRERQRLENNASIGPKEKKTNTFKEQPRKGAWFEGFE